MAPKKVEEVKVTIFREKDATTTTFLLSSGLSIANLKQKLQGEFNVLVADITIRHQGHLKADSELIGGKSLMSMQEKAGTPLISMDAETLMLFTALELRELCSEQGIKATKSCGKPDLVRLLKSSSSTTSGSSSIIVSIKTLSGVIVPASVQAGSVIDIRNYIQAEAVETETETENTKLRGRVKKYREHIKLLEQRIAEFEEEAEQEQEEEEADSEKPDVQEEAEEQSKVEQQEEEEAEQVEIKAEQQVEALDVVEDEIAEGPPATQLTFQADQKKNKKNKKKNKN